MADQDQKILDDAIDVLTGTEVSGRASIAGDVVSANISRDGAESAMDKLLSLGYRVVSAPEVQDLALLKKATEALTGAEVEAYGGIFGWSGRKVRVSLETTGGKTLTDRLMLMGWRFEQNA